MLMIIIVSSLAVVAIFANIQRLRRGQIETIVVVPLGRLAACPEPGLCDA